MKLNITTYKLNNSSIFTKPLLKGYITKFWREYVSNLVNQYISILFKLEYSDGSTKTIGTLQSWNKGDKKNL